MSIRTNLTEEQHVQFSFLSEGQKRLIFNEVLEILQYTGVRVKHDQACELLARDGCTVNGQHVYMPSHVVSRALDSVPPISNIYSWDGKVSLKLKHGHTYFGPGPTCPNFIDPFTFERRAYTRQDATMVARLCDALPGIGFVMSLGFVSDTPYGMEGLYEFAEMIQNSTKPPIAWCFTREHSCDIHNIGIALAGSAENFRQRPNFIFYNEPISPLLSDYNAIDKVIYCAENNIPQVFAPASTGGGTVPATHGAHIAVTLAESLIGIVVSQIVNPGASIIIGGTQSILDMRDMVFAYGAPELSSLEAGLTEMAEFLGLPVFSAGGCSDSKTMDAQAAIEDTLSLHSAMLSGPNLVHDVGFMESGMCGSVFQLVLADEIISKSEFIAKGVLVNEETLARREIQEAGPGGDYRKISGPSKKLGYQWSPRPQGVEGRGDVQSPMHACMPDRIVERAQALIRDYEGPAAKISEEVKQEIKQILETAETRSSSGQ